MVPTPLRRAAFQRDIAGSATDLYTLRSAGGLEVSLCNHAARLVQVRVPDAQGRHVDVTLGYDSLDGYLQGQPSMGALIGRHAGRLGHGRLRLGTQEYGLPVNSGPHCLHGGPGGSRHQVFRVRDAGPRHLQLSHTFRPEADGFPGTVELDLTVAVDDDNGLSVDWAARALDVPTVLNLTWHPFFNLAGGGPVDDHWLEVPATHWLPLDATLLPTGELAEVTGRAFDFRSAVRLGDVWQHPDPALRLAGGLDHYLVLAPRPGMAPALRQIARLHCPGSGLSLDVHATDPGLQVYGGHGLTGQRPRDLGRGGVLYTPRSGLCLEPMGFPDAPHHRLFPFQPLAAGEWRRGQWQYRFSARPAAPANRHTDL